jgi:hypothetical protein
MTTATQPRVRVMLSQVRPNPPTSGKDPGPGIGNGVAVLAIPVVVALLALSAALTLMQIPGAPIWHELPPNWPVV